MLLRVPPPLLVPGCKHYRQHQQHTHNAAQHNANHLAHRQTRPTRRGDAVSGFRRPKIAWRQHPGLFRVQLNIGSKQAKPVQRLD
jgi:ribosomal protein L44E